jgi:hypothetical protein
MVTRRSRCGARDTRKPECYGGYRAILALVRLIKSLYILARFCRETGSSHRVPATGQPRARGCRTAGDATVSGAGQALGNN